jgi:tetratricopeptide (TPR) repeat protein
VLRPSLVPIPALALAFSFLLGLGALSGCDDKKLDPAAQAEQNKNDLANGAARVRDEKYDEAESMFARVLAVEPENPEALAGMGRVKLGQKKIEEGVSLLERAAGKLPDDGTIQASLAEAYAKLDRHMDAATAYAHAFKADPNNGNLGIAQAKALQKAKQLDQAEAILREVAKVDPQAEYVYTELGDVLRAQGKLDDALKSYMKALIEHVGDEKAHAGAAEVYELQNNRAKAIDEWSTYIRMDCCSEYSNSVAKKRIKALQDANPPKPAEG